ncbi:winged helix-turn-helix domain-containing protein [Glaciihabitans tibetensis]|uniref:winged helix-turn-helix domain-containing protein n=1 Tax=Glaciihabitans tibetensis TaxID=1266600 RepID=UPI001FE5607A|nr:crosslink repair DNA glycosylase YcaQ family protein [Glaciihabitans tibetensis]
MAVKGSPVRVPSAQISPAQARRIALAAQGFGRARPTAVGVRQLGATVARLGLLQLDSVNVFERSHYMPAFSRLGPYNKADLDRLTLDRSARYTEYWAHEASLIPRHTWPLWRWKMDDRRRKQEDDPQSWIHANHDMLQWLRDELADKGPLPAGKIESDAGRRRGGWWEWSDVKRGLEMLFSWGEVVSAGRTSFQRVYGLAAQVLTPELLNAEVSRRDAQRQLLLWSAKAHGIGTVGDLADYYRLKSQQAKPLLEELADAGEILPLLVPGWEVNGRPRLAYLHSEAKVPRRINTGALLSPFDPVVWERNRALRLFDFHYRIEIYTPEPQRVYGYYTLPVLINDRIVARIDLKSDRQNRVLRVQSAWNEAALALGVVDRIAILLREAAAWQQLDDIVVVDRGDLAAALAAELRTPLLPRPY